MSIVRYYGVCDCYVWLLAATGAVGRCGRCGTRPEGFFRDKDEAMAFFFANHTHLPEPIR